MRIVFVTQFFSKGMGYTENMLPKFLSKLGHEVLVLTSDLQVYGNSLKYKSNYQSFLGEANCGEVVENYQGFTLKRVKHYSLKNYIGLKGLRKAIEEFQPDIIQFSQAAGLDTFTTLIFKFKLNCPIFTECHQHKSIAKTFIKKKGNFINLKKFFYLLTRTFPSWVAHKRIEKCFAISPDCLKVANVNYGVPKKKLILLPLGTDTENFHPCNSKIDRINRVKIRKNLNVDDNEILVIYTGRFSDNKDPLTLARAINILRKKNLKYKAIFIGSGEQANQIAIKDGCSILDFQIQENLANFYRAADIAVWPREDSMSMLDAASSGLPLIVSDEIGELDRIKGNGFTYKDKNVASLVSVLSKLSDKSLRKKLGIIGRKKMINSFSWTKHAKVRERYYKISLYPT